MRITLENFNYKGKHWNQFCCRIQEKDVEKLPEKDILKIVSKALDMAKHK